MLARYRFRPFASHADAFDAEPSRRVAAARVMNNSPLLGITRPHLRCYAAARIEYFDRR